MLKKVGGEGKGGYFVYRGKFFEVFIFVDYSKK